MIYGKRLIFEVAEHPENFGLTESAQIIENSFEFLDEAGIESGIKKQIDALKGKDKITKSDINPIISSIDKIVDKEKKKMTIAMVIETLLVMASVILVESHPLAGLLVCLTSGTALMTTDTVKSYIGNDTNIYAKIIKLEAKIRNKIKKIQALDVKNNDTTTQLKDLNKSLEIIDKLKANFKNVKVGRDVDPIYQEAVLLEFKGNEDKTEAFRIIMEELAGYCEYNYEKVKTAAKTIDEMIALYKEALAAKDPKIVNEKAVAIRELGRKRIKEIESEGDKKGVVFGISFDVLKKDMNSFTAKYSQVTMEDKKRIAKKLNNLAVKVFSVGIKYSASNTEFKTTVIGLKDEAMDQDKTRLTESINIIFDWLVYIVREYTYTINDIREIVKVLDIPEKETRLYRILNPIKKK